MAQPKSFLQAAKFTAPTLYLFTWRFSVGYNPHSFAVVAENEKQALQKIHHLLKEGKYIRREGHYTAVAPFEKINFSENPLADTDPFAKQMDRPKFHEKSSVENLLKFQRPEVNSLDAILSISCLDG